MMRNEDNGQLNQQPVGAYFASEKSFSEEKTELSARRGAFAAFRIARGKNRAEPRALH